MTALIEHQQSRAGTTDIRDLWYSIRTCLQEYIWQDSPNGRYAKIIAHHIRRFVNAVQKLPNYQEKFRLLQSQQRYESPWYRCRIATDQVMEAELITVFGECPTPIHSYDGPVGIVFVVDGELTLSRYAETNNAISQYSAISNLSCERVDRYTLTHGTLIDSLSTPAVEMQANTERCIFFNIHLRDQRDQPHYFYYPSYLASSDQLTDHRRFFANRIPSEW